MTQDEWLACQDVRTMLRFLGVRLDDYSPERMHGPTRFWKVHRKLRLYLCACWRLSYGLGRTSTAELDLIEEIVDGRKLPVWPEPGFDLCHRRFSFWSNPEQAACEKSGQLYGDVLAHLVREMFGNPFVAAPAARSVASWLAWNDGAIGKFALAVYKERAFGHLPLIADMLEDAGCEHALILSHCRNGGRHFRGCWAVDLLIGKGLSQRRGAWRRKWAHSAGSS